MKKLILAITVLLTFTQVYSQEISAANSSTKMTVYDIQRNSLHAELIPLYFLSAFFERTIPTGERNAIIAGVGFTQGLQENTQDLPVKIALILGGSRHF